MSETGRKRVASMTRDEILAMKPGRELDALVAEKVMGWIFAVDKTSPHLKVVMLQGPMVRLPHLFTQITAMQAIYMRAEKAFEEELRHYSTDFSAALEIVEQLSLMGYFVNVCRFPWTLRSNVQVQKVVNPETGELDRPIQLQDDTAGIAICKAALLARLEAEAI